MKKIFYLLLILSFNLGSLSAQIFKSKVNPFPLQSSKIFSSQGTLRILAVMVEFQEDKYDATVGNGKFGSVYSQDYGDSILDPLPHDAEYFSNHLEFAKNYFNRVSKEKINITYNVIPTQVTLSKTMREYSPPYDSDDLSPLGYLAEETWQLVDQTVNGINFDDYDLFMIFHPGVSRGLDFGSFFLDRNLPSLYLSDDALKNIFGNDFNGFPVNGGNSRITNSILLPETESRELEAIDGSIVLLQLTINGLIVANIASYLGLPDLFDTETGLSVIGRFGLMDGQGIFANSGMFPPEPSPWEKIFLGWETPVTLPALPGRFNLSTRLSAISSDTTLIKIPISATEYYLVENRSQDANRDNSTITMKLNGELIQKSFSPDSTGLFNINPDSLKGVVVDVDEYDVSIPGNGIVIWHIDEEIINENFSLNKINIDEFRRGVDIEEADGIQDIVVQFNTVFGTFINDGSYEDFWYSSNSAELFENEFSSITKPNTKTNDGANSLIAFTNFSDAANRMSFDLMFGNENIELVSKFTLSDNPQGKSVTALGNDLPVQYLHVSGNNVVWHDDFGNIIESFQEFSEFKPAGLSINGITYIVGVKHSIVNLFVSDTFGAHIYSQDIGTIITAPPVLRFNSTNELQLLLGTNDGSVTITAVENITSGSGINFIPTEISSRQNVKQICAHGDYYSMVTENTYSDVNEVILQFPHAVKKAILTKDQLGDYITVVLSENNMFYVIKNSVIQNEFEIESINEVESFILIDLLKDGSNYIAFANGNQFDVVNFDGRYADNFPLNDPEKIGFSGTPLSVDLDLDNFPDIITSTLDGRIFAYSAVTGKVIDNYPVSTGALLTNLILAKYYNPVMSMNNHDIYLSAIDNQRNFYSWKIASHTSRLFWTEEYGSSMNNSFVSMAETVNSADEYFPKDKAYNWPNPVYDGVTFIRYFVSEDSNVEIKIFDLSGDLVAEIIDFARGGFDHETTWNVSDIESGVYFARLQVNGSSGVSDSKIIKIAVIK